MSWASADASPATRRRSLAFSHTTHRLADRITVITVTRDNHYEHKIMATFTKENIPHDLKYVQSHEWVRVEGDIATIGITHFAAEGLGDIVYVEFPDVGTEFGAGDDFGVVESVKAVSDVYTPVSGTVVEVHEGLEDAWDSVNSDPYGEGWILKIRLSVPEELNALMDAEAYIAHLNS